MTTVAQRAEKGSEVELERAAGSFGVKTVWDTLWPLWLPMALRAEREKLVKLWSNTSKLVMSNTEC